MEKKKELSKKQRKCCSGGRAAAHPVKISSLVLKGAIADTEKILAELKAMRSGISAATYDIVGYAKSEPWYSKTVRETD